MKKFWSFQHDLTALIPESCCANIIIKAMNNGDLSAPLVNISLNEICGMSFIFSCSALISSISEWTSTLPRSQFNALVARSSSSLSKSKNLGDSGQNGKVTTWYIRKKNQNIQYQYAWKNVSMIVCFICIIKGLVPGIALESLSVQKE